MNRKPLISIITPAYNSEKFIRRTWRSIKGQTYKNFEWIIIDDGSKDNSRDIIDSSLRDKRIKKIFLKNNKGANHARNVGDKKCKGDYVIYLDADDLFHNKNSIQEMVNEIIKTDKKVSQVIFPVITASGNNRSQTYCKDKSFRIDYPENICRTRIRGDFFSITKKSIVKQLRWPEEYYGMESLRHFRMYEKYSLIYVNKPMMIYNDSHENNQTSAANLLKRTKELEKGTKLLIHRYKNVWIKNCKRTYGRYLFKLSFYQALQGKNGESWRTLLRSALNNGPKVDITILVLLLIIPINLRRYLFIKLKRRISRVY